MNKGSIHRRDAESRKGGIEKWCEKLCADWLQEIVFSLRHSAFSAPLR